MYKGSYESRAGNQRVVMGLEGIFQVIDGYRDEAIDLETALASRVALGPENGGSGEHEKTRFVKSIFESIKPDSVEEIRAPDTRAEDGYRPNLIARWGGSFGESVVWVLSHSDVVPPGDLSLWETDPYEVQVSGDRVIGRGVEDNQHGIISSYLGLKGIMECGEKPKRPVGLAVVADEETGSEYGLNYILKNHRGLFEDKDLIVIPDGGNDQGTMIEIAEKSMLWIRFTVTGRQCHASTPQKGINSLFGAAKLIVALDKLKERFSISDPLFSSPVSTFEPTKMEANVPNINTIPGKDVFYLDCRVLPKYSILEVLNAGEEIASGISSEVGISVRMDVIHRQEAPEPTPEDAPVVEALSGALKRVDGREAKPMGIGGGTVAAFFRKAGLPAAVWCTLSDTAHQPNEYCLISNILTDAKVFAALYMGEY